MQSELHKDRDSLDIVFLSFNETNSDKNWIELKRRFPRAKRVHGVRGISQAHKQAASKSSTQFFFTVDGDNRIIPEFGFTTPDIDLDEKSLYVYRCRNPLTGMVYGYGAVKIYNKALLDSAPDGGFLDLATTITPRYKILPEIASETFFFNSNEEAWRGAFRECFKLARSLAEGAPNSETELRLKSWCEFESNLRYAEWARLGARQGIELANSEQADICRINDFEWLRRFFNEHAN